MITVPLAINYLGPERYGLWMLVSSTMAFAYLLDGGVMPELKNRMSVAFAVGDLDESSRWEAASLLVAALVAVVGIFLAACSTLFNWAVILGAVDKRAASDAQRLFPLLSLVFSIRAALSSVDAIYAAKLEIHKVQVVDVLASAVSLLALWFGMKAQVGLATLACAVAAPPVVGRAGLLVLLVHRASGFPTKLREVWPSIRGAIPNGLYFFGIKVAEVILVSLPSFALAHVRNLEEVATFSVVQRLAAAPQVLVTAVLPVFWPVFTVAWVRGDRLWLRRALVGAVGGTALVYVCYSAGAYWLGPAVVRIWTANKIGADCWELTLVCLAAGVQTAFYWTSTFLHSISDFRFELACHILCLGILGVLVVPAASLVGVAGIGLALLVAWLFGCLVPSLVRTRRWFRGLVTGPSWNVLHTV